MRLDAAQAARSSEINRRDSDPLQGGWQGGAAQCIADSLGAAALRGASGTGNVAPGDWPSVIPFADALLA